MMRAGGGWRATRGAPFAPGVARRLLGGRELLLDQHEAGIPETGICEVDADEASELFGRHRPTGRQQPQVVRHKAGALVLVALVDRQRQQLTVRVRVDVARRVDEVGM